MIEVTLEGMITHYKTHGERVDEVLFQEVMTAVERVEYLEMKYENSGSIFSRQNQLIKIEELAKENERLCEAINKSIAHFRQDEHPEGMHLLECVSNDKTHKT